MNTKDPSSQEEEDLKPWTQFIQDRFETEDKLKQSWEDFPQPGESWELIKKPLGEKGARYETYQVFKGKINPKNETEDLVYNEDSDDEDDDYFKEETKIVSPEEVFKIRCKIEGRNKYKLTQVQQRCILLCGKTRSGKSTCMEVLKNPTYIPKMMNIFSDTQSAVFYDFAMNTGDKMSNISIKAIDTPGLFEVTEVGRESRKTQQILNIIGECIENEITFLHAIFFFITFETGLQKEDIESIKLLLKMFGQSNIKFGLVVTRCEKKNTEFKKNIVNQIANHKELKELVHNNKMKIFFSGCVVPSQSSTKNDLEESYKSVYRMRTKILKYIFNLDVSKKAMLREMPFIANRLDDLKKEIKKLTKQWSFFLSKKQNIEELKIEQKMRKVELLSNEVFKSKKLIVGLDMTDKENFVLFQRFNEIGRKLSKTDYPDYVKMKLLGDYYNSFVETKKV